MKNGQNVDDARSNQIHNPVQPDDHLADIRPLQFRHDAARFGELTQTVRRLEESFGMEVGIARRVAGDVVPDRLDILDGAERPDNSSHRLPSNRRFASS